MNEWMDDDSIHLWNLGSWASADGTPMVWGEKADDEIEPDVGLDVSCLGAEEVSESIELRS